MVSKRKILAVDDEEGIVEYLQFLFQNAGYEVKTAGGGWEAWDLIRSEPFDFVITDVRMVKGDGIELVEKICDMDSPKPKVAIMSAYTDVSTADVFERGAVGLVQKPPKSEKILETVVEALRPLNEKWLSAVPVEDTKNLTLHYPSWAEAIKNGKLCLGAGGLFVHLDNDFPLVDSAINFTLTFSSGSPGELKGAGIARWVRAACLKVFYTGIGLEFTSLDAASRKFVLQQIESHGPRSFIPVGQASASTR
jgi:CheY-like chemotaxis protein